MMGDVIIFNDESIDFIWNTIQNQQIIFHPEIAPEGKIKYDIFAATKRRKTLTLFVDRNILSSLLKFCEIGSLKNKGESQLIGVIMAWAIFNDMPISAGMAIKERAFQLRSQEKGLVELQKFLEIFEVYPGQMWLQVAEGQLAEIPPIKYSNTLAQNISVNYADGGDHYDMAVASLLHAVWLYRDQTKRPIEKVREFIQWMYDYLLVSEYLLVYVIMLLTGQDNIKAPKHANSNDLGKIVAGCKNQAWDIAYLTNWSTLYSDTDKYSEEFLFATNDILLKRIFVNCNTPFGVNGLLFNVFHKKEYNQLMDYIEDRVRNRIKPDFGGKPQVYFQELIEEEKRKIQTLLKI
nr:hypothetical protein [uncultured Oscillibacter sp.]